METNYYKINYWKDQKHEKNSFLCYNFYLVHSQTIR